MIDRAKSASILKLALEAPLVKRLLCIGLFLSASVAIAGDDDDDDALFQDKPKPATNSAPNASTFKDDEEDDLPSFVSTPPKKEDDERTPGSMASLMQTTKMPLEVTGKDVLADNWPATVVFNDADAVVVEIPVLYARNRAEFDGVTYFLVATVYADGKKVAENRIQVNRDAIADKGPSIQFFRMFVPVAGKTGVLEVKVGKATSASAPPALLFTRSVNYKL